MPKTFVMKMVPAGLTVESVLPGENVVVQITGFYSSDNGGDFANAAQQLTKCFAPHVFADNGLRPSLIDNLLLLVDRERNATVYCNELNSKVQAQAKRNLKPGERVTQDDVVDFDRLVLVDRHGEPVEIPNDCGVVTLLSLGWSKWLYFDFAPLDGKAVRTDDLATLFGKFHSYVCFQEVYGINEAQWHRLIEWGWFPFAWMSVEDRKGLVSFTCRDEPPQPLFEELSNKFKAILDERSAAWRTVPLFGEHTDFIAEAISTYKDGKYIACTQILYPRIEGVLRHMLLACNHSGSMTQSTMVDNLAQRRQGLSTLLPTRFREYMTRYYFRGFDGRQSSGPLSRHTIAHGVSAASEHDFVKASLAFMILDQIQYYVCDLQMPVVAPAAES